MTKPIGQSNLDVTVTTTAGDGAFQLLGLTAHEGVSDPFVYELGLLSTDPSVDLAGLVGTKASVRLAGRGKLQRHFHGLVTRATQGETAGGLTQYRLVLEPWLRLLGLTSDSRIFQELTVPEILSAIFDEFGFPDYRDALSREYAQREHCVQYQETALQFVSRLMEDEGIFYFFEHTEDSHVLVMADDASAHTPCPVNASLKYTTVHSGSDFADGVSRCELQHTRQPDAYAVGDFDFETPTTPLTATTAGDDSTFELFEYPAGFKVKTDGEDRAAQRIGRYEWGARILRGDSSCRTLAPGYTMKLTGHPRKDINDTYIIVGVEHSASQESFGNRFTAVPRGVTLTPQAKTQSPRIFGAQTALVVGSEGEEIWTDEYGRVKVQFHWDRRGESDENSSGWIRVAQTWAGSGWGAFALPRVGQEVVVSFLNGDPDRPIITGAVYNAENTVPYALPAGATRTTLKSNSSKGGGAFNEVRLEDKAGSEEMLLQAGKDMLIDVPGNLDIKVTGTVTIKGSQIKLN